MFLHINDSLKRLWVNVSRHCSALLFSLTQLISFITVLLQSRFDRCLNVFVAVCINDDWSEESWLRSRCVGSGRWLTRCCLWHLWDHQSGASTGYMLLIIRNKLSVPNLESFLRFIAVIFNCQWSCDNYRSMHHDLVCCSMNSCRSMHEGSVNADVDQGIKTWSWFSENFISSRHVVSLPCSPTPIGTCMFTCIVHLFHVHLHLRTCMFTRIVHLYNNFHVHLLFMMQKTQIDSTDPSGDTISEVKGHIRFEEIHFVYPARANVQVNWISCSLIIECNKQCTPQVNQVATCCFYPTPPPMKWTMLYILMKELRNPLFLVVSITECIRMRCQWLKFLKNMDSVKIYFFRWEVFLNLFIGVFDWPSIKATSCKV